MARRTPVPYGDDQAYGEKFDYDPNFNGPLKSRSCTDIICLFLFMIMIACSIGVAIFAYVNGDPQMLLAPKDSSGSRCGLDMHVADKPYLVFFDLTKCLSPNVPFTHCDTPQVCVTKCPNEFFLLDELHGANDKLNDMVCIGNERPPDKKQAEQWVKDGKCAKWLLPSEPVLGRCVPNMKDGGLKDFIKKLGSAVTIDDLKSATKNIEFIANADKVGHDVVEDIKKSWPEILGGLGLAIAMCIIYIAVMRWIAAVMVWLSILGSIALLSFCTYLCGAQYSYYKEHKYAHEDANNVFEKYTKKSEFWLALLIVMSIILVVLLFLLIFLRKRIVLAIGLIREGSKAISATTSALFFPIVPWILQMIVIAYAISVGLYLSAVGKPVYQVRNAEGCSSCFENGASCDPKTFASLVSNCKVSTCQALCKFVEMDHPAIIPYTHAYNIFCFFWLVFFMQALGEMILASTFATWYWTFEKSQVPFFNVTISTGRILRYHIGTLAFGSLIIAICRMIRVALEYIDHKLKKYDNEITKAILCCMKCFFWCLEKFLKFINKNAYIMCAIHGKNFCSSAKSAFSLLLRNIVRVFVLDKVTDFLFFLSKVMVTIGVSAIVYSFIEFLSEKKLTYNFAPVIFVAVCTYLVASVFFSVYTMAVDTLFLCFLEDCERNDGSPNKPYFMSRDLMKVLGKKNKMS